MSGDPSQVLDVLRDVLLRHMDDPEALPVYRVQSAVLIGRRSGRLMSEDDVTSGHDIPNGLRLTMRSGDEYDLTLDWPKEEEAEDESDA
jgi:hypothetical protein